MLKTLNLVPIKPNLKFIGKQKLFFIISALFLVLSIGSFLTRSLNYGIDFQGGIMIEIRTTLPGNLAQMRNLLSDLKLGEISLQEFGEPTDFLIRVQKQDGGERAQQKAVEKVKASLPPDVEYRRTEFVGPKVSDDLFRDGILAVIFAIIGILATYGLDLSGSLALGRLLLFVMMC